MEFVLPLNAYIPSEANISNLQPTLLRLEVMGKDSVRMATTRKVALKPKKQGRFDRHPTIERTELSVNQSVVPADVEKQANNLFVLRPKEPVLADEYALIVFTRSESGTYTENVPLRAQWTPEEMTRFLKKGEEWTGYGALAWDFRVVK